LQAVLIWYEIIHNYFLTERQTYINLPYDTVVSV